MDGTPPLIDYPWSEPPQGAEATEIAEGILWLRMPLPIQLDHVNIFALDDGDGWTIVDTGFDTKASRELWQAWMAGPLKGKPINRVLVTHHHPDHIGLAGWMQTQFGAELWTTRTAWYFARMLLLDVQDEHDPQTLAFWRAAGLPREMYEQRLTERPYNMRNMVSMLPLGFHRIKEGDRITIGGRDWDIHMGNGHAPEHATFWSRDDNLVLGGDQLLPSISPNLGVYAYEPEADPVAEWLASCARFGTIARSDHLVLPGHKLPYTGLPVRLRQMIEGHHGALRRLHEFLETPHVACDTFLTLFKRNIGDAGYNFAMAEAVAHLNHLHRNGHLVRWKNDDDAWLWQATSAHDQ